MQTVAHSVGSQKLREVFAQAEKLLVLTGAGVSAESGVPTFRGGGNTSVWRGMPFEVISSAGMLQRDLLAVWEWFNYRRNLLTALRPNAAHEAIAQWQTHFKHLCLVTQNIDGLHQAAGSQDVIELHGSIWRARCFDCGSRYELRDLRIDDDVPSCSDCRGRLRPDVVLFGEMLPPGAFEQAASEAGNCDLCFVIGTSAVVYPAAAIPEIARAAGAYVIEVNPESTPLSALCHEVLTGRAGEILPMFSKW
jgi:NAD-dependent deacetylase